jgi:hypothetical protein
MLSFSLFGTQTHALGTEDIDNADELEIRTIENLLKKELENDIAAKEESLLKKYAEKEAYLKQ